MWLISVSCKSQADSTRRARKRRGYGVRVIINSLAHSPIALRRHTAIALEAAGALTACAVAEGKRAQSFGWNSNVQHRVSTGARPSASPVG